MTTVDRILSKMTEEDKAKLQSIYEPVDVATPFDDARRSIMVMPDGEIRVYGQYNEKHYGDHSTKCYISSIDGGLTWSFKDVPTNVMGPCVYIPEKNRYVTVTMAESFQGAPKTSVLISEVGPNDTNYKKIELDITTTCAFQPKLIKNGTRLVSTAQCYDKANDDHHPVFFYSDDFGDSWKWVVLKSSEKYSVRYPNKVPRWENNGGEPVVSEMPNGKLMLIARTSLDNFYVYYSSDYGETWTDGEDSYFNGTLTTPFFLELVDGRTMFFFNNTQKLPLEKDCIMAKGSSHRHVFTNRDANHAAITSDFKTWYGFREMHLSPIRNRADYRTYGNSFASRDKSVHQFQAIELPFNKVLVCFGQSATRRLIIFDINWLYEKSRKEDFSKGLESVSTHMFVKSYSGSMGLLGHCQWNRTNGALLVPNPDLDGTEALQICRPYDPRLHKDKQAVVWNFPNAKKGKIEIDVNLLSKGVNVSLLNRWFNPCDDTAQNHAVFNFKLTEKELKEKVWQTILIEFDVENKLASVYNGGELLFKTKLLNEVYHGVSYIHIQTDAEVGDYEGTLIKRLEFIGE